MVLMRLMVALLGAAWIAAFNHYRYLDAERPGGDAFWLSAAGGLLFIGVLVAVGAVVARWWAPLLALTLLLSEAAFALADAIPPDGVPPPLTHAPSFVGGTLFFALLIAAGVGARKLAGTLRRSTPDSTLDSLPS